MNDSVEIEKEMPIKIRVLNSDPQKCSEHCCFFHGKFMENHRSGSDDILSIDSGEHNSWAEISCILFCVKLAKKVVDLNYVPPNQ